MPNSNKSTNLTKIPDYAIAAWNLGNAKHRENGLKLTDFCILPSSSSEACIAEYVRIPSYKYEYVYT